VIKRIMFRLQPERVRQHHFAALAKEGEGPRKVALK